MPAPADELPARLPAWVTLADALTIVIGLAAVAAAMGGGFRIDLGFDRLSVTTPLGPLLVASAIAALRLYRYRSPNVLQRMSRSVRRFASREGFGVALGPFVATRVAVLAIGILAVFTFGMPKEAGSLSVSDSKLVNLPLRYDAGWYLSVARMGYMWLPRDRELGRQQNIVFFPALPMGMRVLGYVFGRSGVAYLYAGVLISHVAFLVALVLLYELARDDLGDRAAAVAAVALLASYPFSLFHGAVYTESLYLLGVVGCVLAVKRARWSQAIAWGLLVGLTRPNGMVLSLTLATLLVESIWRQRSRSQGWNKVQIQALAAVASPIVGAALYSLYIWHLTGNPLQWQSQQIAWGRTFSGFSPITGAAQFTAEYGIESYVEMVPYDVMNGLPALAALALAIPIGRRLGWAYAVFILTNLVPPLLLGGALSAGRFTATLFPLFIWLGGRTRSATTGVMLFFAMLQGFCAALFYTWRPLF
jgi:hypothetical protein